jgi:hypothetical protein
MSSFVIHPLPAGAVDVEAATARQTVADSPLPCRRCLRNATIGDPLVLAAYNQMMDSARGRTSTAAG